MHSKFGLSSPSTKKYLKYVDIIDCRMNNVDANINQLYNGLLHVLSWFNINKIIDEIVKLYANIPQSMFLAKLPMWNRAFLRSPK